LDLTPRTRDKQSINISTSQRRIDSICHIPSKHGLLFKFIDFFRVDPTKIDRDLLVAHEDRAGIMRPAAGRVVRQKKLSRSSGQQILREDELDSQEYDSLQANYQVETGVEKSEEKARDQSYITCIVYQPIITWSNLTN